jgi:hypothetical protein
MSNLSCLCTDPLQSPGNVKCDAGDYGNQIVIIAFQKMTGTDFDGTSGNTITVEADWNTKLAADNDDRIVIFKNLSNGIMPATEPNVDEGNAVAYGGIDVIDQMREINASVKYFTPADLAILDKVACWDQVRMWFFTNRNWVFGDVVSTGAGIPFVSVIKHSLAMEGIGTKPNVPIRAVWNAICEPKPIAQLGFVSNLVGSNQSGSAL